MIATQHGAYEEGEWGSVNVLYVECNVRNGQLAGVSLEQRTRLALDLGSCEKDATTSEALASSSF